MTAVSAVLCGMLFGIGLAASGMTDTAKVLGFLHLFTQWDADLLWVMGAAVATTTLGFTLIFKQVHKPLFAQKFSLPSRKTVDYPLLLGAALFVIGWGLFGYCAGPALASMVYLSPVMFIFVATMLLGMALGQGLSIRLPRRD